MGEKNPAFFAFTLIIGIICFLISVIVLCVDAIKCNSNNLDSCNNIHSYSSSYKGLIAGAVMTIISIGALSMF
jgi:hypothetical protein